MATKTSTTTATETVNIRSRRADQSTLNATPTTEGSTSTTAKEQEKKDAPRIKRKYRHVAAVHSRSVTSCLSHESEAAPSFIGFRNLMVIVLIVGNMRLMVENFKKYGVLICISCHDYQRQDLILGFALWILIPCHLFAAYLIERAAAQQARASLATLKKRDGSHTPTDDERKKFQSTWIMIAWAHGINITLCLTITSMIVYFSVHHPLIGTLSEIHAVIVWLKTFSYAFTNRDLRHAYLHPSKRVEDATPEIYEQCPYPENITLSNLTYFWWAPTLVYQPVYPRTEKIRWVYVAKRLAEVFGLSVFIWIVSAQYGAPLLRNSLDGMASFNLTSILERLMKLSTISLVCWLAGFFALFQSFLNALAEVTRFGDRNFYDDWWNSPSVGVYWRTWNKPVYQFMKRHIFSPLVGRGWSSGTASIMVFVFSGVLHELCVGVPTHNIIGVAFIGMIAQLPLIAITTPLEKAKGHYGRILGNCTFWISFVLIGQPLAAMIYFFAWQSRFGSQLKDQRVSS